jgi:Beta-propeller repeat
MSANPTRQVVTLSVIILTGLISATALYASGEPSHSAATYFKAPLRFEPNEGQSMPGIDFVSHGKGFVLHLSSTAAIFGLPEEQITMQLDGSNEQAQASTIDPLESKVNYFIGTDPTKWLTGIPTFGKTRYQGVYPGIDLVYYGDGEQLEYDFVVSPGADPKQIALTFPETRKLRVDRGGDLLLTGKYGTLSFHKPVVYQQIDGLRRQIAAKFAIYNGRVRFDVGSYDSRQPLVIDPTLQFATYFGGSTFDEVLAIATDPSSNAYVTGLTQSKMNFPLTAGAYQSSLAGATAAFVTKLNASGNIVFSTYFGGTDSGSNTQGNAIALDSLGNVYIAGNTDSNALPTKGGNGIEVQKGSSGGSSGGPVTAISNFSSDNTFVRSRTGSLPGVHTVDNTTPSATGLTVNLIAQGQGGVAGTTGPATFVSINQPGTGYKVGDSITTVPPVGGGTATFTVAAVAAEGSNEPAAFVSEFDPTGGVLLNSTYVSGTGNTACPNGASARGIAVDSALGNVYITGSTDSSLLTGMASPSCTGAFAMMLNFNAPGIFQWGKLIGVGSTSADAGNGVAIGPSGNVYITGSESSNVFVAKLNHTDGSSLYFVTEGGTGFTTGNAIAVDASGNAYVAGSTLSAGASFITTNTSTTTAALQPTYGGPSGGGGAYGDGFVLKFDPNGTLLYGSYLGGTSDDYATGITLDAKGNVSIIGSTQSTDFPVVPANSSTNSGGFDVFVARFNSGFTTEFYASYLGGSAADFSTGLAAAVDPVTGANNSFFGGYTDSNNFAGKTRNSTTTTGFIAMISDPNPAKLQFTVPPTNTLAGLVVTPNVQVSILDSANKPVTAARGPVTIVVQSPAGATVTGGTVTATNGVATFNALSFSPGGSYTVIATDPADGLTTSAVSFTVTQPVLCFTVPPVSTAAGYPIPNIQVAVENGTCSGTTNIITQATNAITLAVTPSGPSTTVNAVNGVATFSGPILNTAGSYTFTATATGVTSATATVTITTPVLCFTAEPVDTKAGGTIPAVKVAIESGSCGGGVIVTQATNAVTIAGRNHNGECIGWCCNILQSQYQHRGQLHTQRHSRDSVRYKYNIQRY